MERNNNRIQTPTPAPSVDRPSGEMTGQGKLVFQITTAGGAIPLEGAEITLRASRSASDGNGGEVIAVLYSDSNGKSEVLTLPAPARMLSLEPADDWCAPRLNGNARGWYAPSDHRPIMVDFDIK